MCRPGIRACPELIWNIAQRCQFCSLPLPAGVIQKRSPNVLVTAIPSICARVPAGRRNGTEPVVSVDQREFHQKQLGEVGGRGFHGAVIRLAVLKRPPARVGRPTRRWYRHCCVTPTQRRRSSSTRTASARTGWPLRAKYSRRSCSPQMRGWSRSPESWAEYGPDASGGFDLSSLECGTQGRNRTADAILFRASNV